MAMFDWYLPAEQQYCPVDKHPLNNWQGKDGPCALFVWYEGQAHPVDQLIDDDEVRWPPEERHHFTLPERFVIYSYDCPLHQPVDATGTAHDGVWNSTVVQPFVPSRP